MWQKQEESCKKGEETSYLVWNLESILEVIHILKLVLLGHFFSEGKHISRFLSYCMILELILELLVFPTTVHILDASEQFDFRRIFTWSHHWDGHFHFLNIFSVLLDCLIWRYLTYYLGFSGGSDLKHPPAVWAIWVWSLGWEDPLDEGIATHSSILAWRIPMDRKAWQAIVHGLTKSRTRLSDSAVARIAMFEKKGTQST